MAEALRLAERGLYTTTPNPRVGCLIVKGGEIVGRGFHARAGEPHAEALALREAGERARGSTVYVSLEPCSHHGRTPPCANALVAAAVGRVVVAMEDPNPRVTGRGLERLRQAGIAVECGVLEEEARALNVGFVSRMTRGRPWVRMKVAASLDGRTALPDGKSQWITGEAARRDAHHWRARSCAVLTGIGTVREDDPRLTVRHVATSRQPLRVVVDSRLETPESARVLAGGPVLIACARDDREAAERLRDTGAEVLYLPNPSGKVDLPALFQLLAERGINEVLVEAGTKLNGSLLREALVDELLVYLAPCLIGDAGRGMASLPTLENLAARLRLKLRDLRLVGEDLRVLAEVVQGEFGPASGRE
jgi:diaminohydroxyphosphoribosylaminopyrimidine deaminase/5-amino-6-(5-phosphoribosylamino)uracil reductase